MATKKTTAAYDADTMHTVVLSDRAEWRGKKFVPGREYEIRGDVLSGPEFAGKIESAEPIVPPDAAGA